MEKNYDKFNVLLLSEVKGKDKNAFIFEFRLTTENNCRIKVTDFEAFDIDGNKFPAAEEDISVTDIILGHSKFFAENKKVNVKISSAFKSKIGCMAVITVVCVEDKRKMSFCFQRKGTNRWDCVGVQFLEYESVVQQPQAVETNTESIPKQELKSEPETEVEAVTEPVVQEEEKAVQKNFSGVQIKQSADGIDIVPIETKPAKIILKKHSISRLKQRIETEGLESYRDISMKKLLLKYEIESETLGSFLDVFKDLLIEAYEEEKSSALEEAAIAEEEEEEAYIVVTQEEETAPPVQEVPETVPEDNSEKLEEFLNSLIEFDEKSAETIGLAVKHIRIRVDEKDDIITPILYCEVSYSKETYVLVRCPMIKVIFYDKKGNIANVAMHSVSRIYTGEDIVEMAFKKSTQKYWLDKSKIKILVTI